MRVDPMELARIDLDKMSEALRALDRALGKVHEVAHSAMDHSSNYTGSLAFAPIISAALATDIMVEGCRAQSKSVRDVIRTSTNHMALKTADDEQRPSHNRSSSEENHG